MQGRCPHFGYARGSKDPQLFHRWTMFDKKKKSLMVVRTDTSKTRTPEERETHLNGVKELVVKKLTEMGIADRYHVLVIPDTVDIQVVD
jgi:hypothetical protein